MVDLSKAHTKSSEHSRFKRTNKLRWVNKTINIFCNTDEEEFKDNIDESLVSGDKIYRSLVGKNVNDYLENGIEKPVYYNDIPVLTSILGVTKKRFFSEFDRKNTFVGKTFKFVVENLIELFSNEGDNIYDPMLGFGTTLFIGSELNRNVSGSDINIDNVNNFIKRWEDKYSLLGELTKDIPIVKVTPAQDLSHIKDESQNLVIMSFPWLSNWGFNKKDNKALDKQSTYMDFLQEAIYIYKEVYRILKYDGYVCNILGDGYNKNGEVIPLTADLIQVVRRIGFTYHYTFWSIRDGIEGIKMPFYRSALYVRMGRDKYKLPICLHEEIPVFKKDRNENKNNYDFNDLKY